VVTVVGTLNQKSSYRETMTNRKNWMKSGGLNRIKGKNVFVIVLKLSILSIVMSCNLLAVNGIVHVTDKTASKLTYGLYFEHLDETSVITGIQRHTIKILLPTHTFEEELNFESGGEVTGGVKLKQTIPCLRELEGKSAKLVCSKFRRNIDFLLQVAREGHTALRDLVNDMNDVLPETKMKRSKSEKRAILGFVGTIGSSIFGWATEEDIAILNKNLIAVSDTVNNELTVMKKITKDLTKFATLATNKINTLVDQMKENAVQNMKMIQFLTDNEEVMRDFGNNLTLFTSKLQHFIFQTQSHYSNLLNSIETLVSGRLPVYLVPKTILAQILSTVGEENEENGFQVIHTDTNYYYTRGSFVYARHENSIFITLQIPLTRYKVKFDYFRITKFEMPMHDDKQHVLELNDIKPGIAISQDNEMYFELTENDLQNHHARTQSDVRRRINKNVRQSCTMAIFLDNKGAIKQNCNYSIVLNSLKGKIEHVSKNQFLLTDISEYQLQCPERHESKIGCKYCIVKISEKCSMHTKDFEIAASLMDDENDVADESVGHIINGPLLLNFFPNESLTELRADSKYLELPQIKIPKFDYFRDNLSRAFSENDKVKIDLNKAVQAVKNDNQIVASLSESIILGDLPIQTLFWLQVPGVVLEITACLTLMLLLLTLYLFNRLRALTIALTLLSNSGQAKANKIILDYYEGRNSESGSQPGKGLHELILEMTRELSAFQTMCVGIAMLGLVLAVRLFIKKIVAIKHPITFKLALELTGTNRTCYISMTELMGKSGDYKITARDFIKNLRVLGWLRQEIHFQWEGVVIENTLNEQRVKFEKIASLTWKESRMIKAILEKPFLVNVVYIKGNEIKRAVVEKEIEGNE
jgi:hypothetical protein